MSFIIIKTAFTVFQVRYNYMFMANFLSHIQCLLQLILEHIKAYVGRRRG